MSIKLYDYQEEGIRDIYNKWKYDRKIILWCNMGGGKSEMAAYIAQDASSDGMPIVMVVRGRELVKNLSRRLDKYKIDHSVFMAGHHRLDKSKLIQIASVDTMKSRGQFPFSDRDCIVILDEAHKDYSLIFEKYKSQFILGLTATPFSDMSSYDDYVCPIRPIELVEKGILVPEEIYCPHVIDTSSLKIVAGDFHREQLAKLVTQGEIVGNVVEDYIKYGQNRPSVCFAVNIEHSKQLRDEFIRRGINAIHCDASSSDEERKFAEDSLLNKSIKVICNVDIFSVGWDCPMVSCIIMARPTWSLVWYLQAIGRGLRSFRDKTNCIVLDNAGNVYRHGTPYREREISLKKPEKKIKRDKDELLIRTCIDCFRIYESSELCCPFCGAHPAPREIKNVNGMLAKYYETEEEKSERTIKEAQIAFYKLRWVASSKGLSNGWIKEQILKRYGDKVMPYIEQLLRIKSR
jgi:superfamily II DNA or RNA helicase